MFKQFFEDSRVLIYDCIHGFICVIYHIFLCEKSQCFLWKHTCFRLSGAGIFVISSADEPGMPKTGLLNRVGKK